VVLSRDLNNATPVTLHLPAQPTGGATLYTLTGDPRANNESSLVIPIARHSLASFPRDYTFTFPPGSAYFFQVPTTPWLEAGPTDISAQASVKSVLLNWAAVPGASGYRIYRSSSPTGRSGAPYVSQRRDIHFRDSKVTAGTTYWYRVSAMKADKETDRSSQVCAIPFGAEAKELGETKNEK
jgi:hypothetical protein